MSFVGQILLLLCLQAFVLWALQSDVLAQRWGRSAQLFLYMMSFFIFLGAFVYFVYFFPEKKLVVITLFFGYNILKILLGAKLACKS